MTSTQQNVQLTLALWFTHVASIGIIPVAASTRSVSCSSITAVFWLLVGNQIRERPGLSRQCGGSSTCWMSCELFHEIVRFKLLAVFIRRVTLPAELVENIKQQRIQITFKLSGNQKAELVFFSPPSFNSNLCPFFLFSFFSTSILTSKQFDSASCYFLHLVPNPAEHREKQ